MVVELDRGSCGCLGRVAQPAVSRPANPIVLSHVPELPQRELEQRQGRQLAKYLLDKLVHEADFELQARPLCWLDNGGPQLGGILWSYSELRKVVVTGGIGV